ncbi:MAG TPA: transglycosylase domain-containing protein [Xanthobacteraceae bacterium]|nr:transglycosylase domain-containing protein [Xanthobacteraceae bacterium]
MALRRKRRVKREPVLDTIGSLFHLRLSESDRPGGAPERASGSKSEKPARAKKKRRRWLPKIRVKRLAYWCVVLGIWGTLAVAGLFAWHSMRLPAMQDLVLPQRPPSISIVGLDGHAIATRGEMGGQSIPIRALPPYLPQAFIAIEDRRFRSHFGVDPIGLARALFVNVSSMQVREGGSTLTQQLAKNLFLTDERTITRKLDELVLSFWLEKEYSKNEILELYLNRVYFGAGAYGVEAAAQRYFGKPARLVTLGEAAILAGLVKAPSRLAPTRNPRLARGRANLVLDAMVEEEFITAEMAKIAKARPAAIVKQTTPGSKGYVADWVMDILDDYIGRVERDVIVQTSIDTRLQAAAEKALTEELEAQAQKYGASQGALIAMDPNGAVRALVGGRSYQDSQFNRAIAAHRQPGSAFKPFVYLAALERGLTPDTVREDGPVNIKGWRPQNYSKEFYGPVTLETALSHSLNTVAVKLGVEVGPQTVVRTARRLGIASKLEPNASIALGTSEVTLLELATAYAPFANGGIGVIPHVIERVRTRDGKIVYARKASGLGSVVSPRYVSMMNRMLEETLLTGTAQRARIPGWPAAGKTGTSQDFRDAWFVGYTGRLVTGVWIGNDDNSPTKRASGSNLPVDVWNRFMRAAHENMPPVGLPGAVEPPGQTPIPPRPIEDGPMAGGPIPPSVRQEAPLDSWLFDRLFGRR